MAALRGAISAAEAAALVDAAARAAQCAGAPRRSLGAVSRAAVAAAASAVARPPPAAGAVSGAEEPGDDSRRATTDAQRERHRRRRTRLAGTRALERGVAAAAAAEAGDPSDMVEPMAIDGPDAFGGPSNDELADFSFQGAAMPRVGAVAAGGGGWSGGRGLGPACRGGCAGGCWVRGRFPGRWRRRRGVLLRQVRRSPRGGRAALRSGRAPERPQ
ncbi:unnamed protein product [Prorocentrum cordatum]|uniref:Uncharacterized protein n=1 Tax=Prorocentrum cordatum TaxID=2364126 RepID=A0ABN9PZF7_9DINO|nr:unnamed protein product [Polarella glacialis]